MKYLLKYLLKYIAERRLNVLDMAGIILIGELMRGEPVTFLNVALFLGMVLLLLFISLIVETVDQGVNP